MSRNREVLTLLVILCLGAFAYGCGGDDGASQEELDKARAEGAKEAKDQAKLDELQADIKSLKKKQNQANKPGSNGVNNSSVAPTNSGFSASSTCTGGVLAGPSTSCSFAMNVAGEYGSNPGASSIQAYSPVTGQQYSMSCYGSGGGTVCTGGNGASVFIP